MYYCLHFTFLFSCKRIATDSLLFSERITNRYRSDNKRTQSRESYFPAELTKKRRCCYATGRVYSKFALFFGSSRNERISHRQTVKILFSIVLFFFFQISLSSIRSLGPNQTSRHRAGLNYFRISRRTDVLSTDWKICKFDVCARRKSEHIETDRGNDDDWL